MSENYFESHIFNYKEPNSVQFLIFLILDPHLSICQVYCAKLKRWSHFSMIKDRKVWVERLALKLFWWNQPKWIFLCAFFQHYLDRSWMVYRACGGNTAVLTLCLTSTQLRSGDKLKEENNINTCVWRNQNILSEQLNFKTTKFSILFKYKYVYL